MLFDWVVPALVSVVAGTTAVFAFQLAMRQIPMHQKHSKALVTPIASAIIGYVVAYLVLQLTLRWAFLTPTADTEVWLTNAEYNRIYIQHQRAAVAIPVLSGVLGFIMGILAARSHVQQQKKNESI